MFYLMTLVTFYLWLYGMRHMIRMEISVLFNDTLNTLYLWLYDIGHMIRMERDVLFSNTTHILFMVIWLQTYDKNGKKCFI